MAVAKLLLVLRHMLQYFVSEQYMDLLPIHCSWGLAGDDYTPVLYQYPTNLHIQISYANVGDAQAIGSGQSEPSHIMVWSPHYRSQVCLEEGLRNHWHLTSGINEARNLDASNHSLHQGLLTNCSGDELVIYTLSPPSAASVSSSKHGALLKTLALSCSSLLWWGLRCRRW